MKIERLESVANPCVKKMAQLLQKKYRQESGDFLVEGLRAVEEAVVSARVKAVFYVQADDQRSLKLLNMAEAKGASLYQTNEMVMTKLCDTVAPQGMVACVQQTICTMTQLAAQKLPGPVVVADRLQDPGNMGTLIRSADALGAGGVLLGDGCADPFSPKALRSTMGSVYHLPVWKCNLPKIMTRLSEQDFLLLCAHLKGSELFPDLPSKSVLVIGNEGNGVSDEVASLCYLYRLPMGRAESLNASVAAGILIYEMARHMNLK